MTHEVLEAVGVLSAEMGHKAYLVGGIVRDIVIGHCNIDLDIMIDSDAPAVARAFARRTGALCKGLTQFGTCKVESKAFGLVDFATARKETYKRPGALPTVEPAGIMSDLARRDFTINAMAISLSPSDYGRLLDPFDGLGDIRRRRLRILHGRSFVDDPTRILRGIRFAARYGLRFERATATNLGRSVSAGCLRSVSGKRVYSELRLLCMEEQAHSGLTMLNRYGILEGIHKGLELDADRMRHLRKVEGALEVAEGLAGEGFLVRWRCRFASLFVGLGRRRSLGLLAYFNPPADVRGECAWVSSDLKRTGAALVGLDRSQAYRITRVLGGVPPEGLVHLYAAGGRHERGLMRKYLEHWRNVRPALTGGQIARMGIGQSPVVGRIIERILRLRLQGKIDSREQEVEYVRRSIARVRRGEKRG